MPRKSRRRWQAFAAVLVLALAGLSTAAYAGPPPPQSDPFYSPPSGYESKAPGDVLRSRQASVAVFSLFSEPIGATQVLYRTTDALGNPSATAALVLVPRAARAHRPLISYQVAEDSLATKCAPAYQLQAGVPPENLVTQAEIIIIDGLLEQGWAVVVPDYQGSSSAFAAGVQSGQMTLDSVRAAERLPSAGLDGAATKVGLMGYSGGSIATGWAAEEQPSYAPELDVQGIAEGGLGADLRAAFTNLDGGLYGGYGLAAALGMSRAYPDMAQELASILNADGKAFSQSISDACNLEIVLRGLFKNSKNLFTVPHPMDMPVIKRVLDENRMGRFRPAAPLFVYHSINDEILPIKPVDDLVAKYCAAGVSVTYQRDVVSEHIALVGTGAPAALAWLQDRMAGKPTTGCHTSTQLSTLLSPAALSALTLYLTGLVPLFFSGT